MRIVHVSDCYLPRAGGIETQVHGLARAQAARGDVVHVITSTPRPAPGDDSDALQDGIVVDRITMQLPFDLPVHVRASHHITTLLRHRPADIVHVHAGVVSPFAWSAIGAACRLQRPVLVTVHSIWNAWARGGYALARHMTRWSRGQVVWSAVSRVAAAGVEAAMPGMVRVIPNGITPQEWITRPEGGAPDELRVAAVLRLAPPKRVIPLLKTIDSARRALRNEQRLRLTLVGAGPERWRAERFIKRRGLEEIVVLAGLQSRDAIRALFSRTDVYVQPSVSEAFGLAALEARAAGLPVIARRQSGSTEFIRQGVEGLLVEDDAAMTTALVELARNPAERLRIAEHNRTQPVEHAWSRVLDIVDEAYAAAMGPRG